MTEIFGGMLVYLALGGMCFVAGILWEKGRDEPLRKWLRGEDW